MSAQICFQMQKCVKANGEKAKKEKKMLENWMAVQQYFDDESTEQDRERRKSANFSGFDLPASEFGRSSETLFLNLQLFLV